MKRFFPVLPCFSYVATSTRMGQNRSYTEIYVRSRACRACKPLVRSARLYETHSFYRVARDRRSCMNKGGNNKTISPIRDNRGIHNIVLSLLIIFGLFSFQRSVERGVLLLTLCVGERGSC